MSQFVKVRHADGRAADVTPAEVAFYRSMGFDPVDGQPDAGVSANDQGGTPGDPLIEEIKGLRSDLAAIFSPGELIGEPVEGTVMFQSEPDPRLDLILDELRGLRSDLAAFWAPGDADPAEPVDGERIELREPATVANFDGLTRDELNTHAASIGIPVPESFPNKPALIEAIRATEAGAAPQ